MSNATQIAHLLPTGTWQVDPVHSQVSFAVDYHVGTFRGSFSPVDAKLTVSDEGDVTLSGSVPVSGVHVQNDQLSGHLQSPDFFDAERAPQITFTAKDFDLNGSQLVVTGDLTIKGTTVEVKATGNVGEQKVYNDTDYFGIKLSTVVDRTDFGINWNNPLPNGEQALGNDVTIDAELFLTRA